jgi:hypothetical protein
MQLLTRAPTSQVFCITHAIKINLKLWNCDVILSEFVLDKFREGGEIGDIGIVANKEPYTFIVCGSNLVNRQTNALFFSHVVTVELRFIILNGFAVVKTHVENQMV